MNVSPLRSLRYRSLCGAAVVWLVSGCQSTPAVSMETLNSAALLHESMGELTSTMVYDIFSPPQASRVYSYASIASYEALRQGDTTWVSLAGQTRNMPPVPAPDRTKEYSWALAGVRAFLTVSHQLTFSRERMDSVRMVISRRYEQALPADVYARSIAYGDTIATHVLAWAGSDGFKQSRGMPKFSITKQAGRWIPTPPAYMDAVEPNWGTIAPFAMDSGSQFRPSTAIPFDSAKGTAFYTQALEVYDTGKTLTDEQRAIASFWDCNPYVMNVQGHTMFATKKITPGGHWMGIAGIASRKANASLLQSADAYARTAMALADGFIAAWDEKYHSGVIRPESVINAYIDEKWMPLLQTPPFPEYPSGHSVISTSAAQVLTAIYGEGFAFADSTETPYGLPVRSFPSFEAAANEAAISRLYGGIHYRQAIEEGQRQGKLVGQHLLARIATKPGTTIATK
ncbi:vanadium-dependent haloperoxidase [Gemmatimonas phototrophica]|uniref:Phosphatidic acid phosphatase n=1 Tax=Gemmatimonas phototrophica TaxID=1379270 RepID=A0A143BI14_9BACT|nr:vanadium-dependent haloperoxidase [Gemmatimonas phototrophica]AMW04054.1 phosphatidic acid phosphatase [Gemmatimonas phototrophica]